MTFQFPMTADLIGRRATAMQAEADVMARIAANLAELERLTGQSLFIGSSAKVSFPAEPFVIDAGMLHVLDDASQAAQDEPQDGTSDISAPRAAKTEPAPLVVKKTGSAATPEPARTMKWAGMTLAERRIVKQLERLPDTFAPVDDLHLVEMLTNGSKIEAVAEFLGVDAAAALARWKSFMSDEVAGPDGRPTIDGQKRLLVALRYRAETA